MAEFVVAIPTFKRPDGLKRLLQALAQLETDCDLEIVVADNDDAQQQGLAVCRELAAGSYRWPLRAFPVVERGIAQVRNALVEAALADGRTRFVAMLDDDEWPEPQWLRELVRIQGDSGADVVRGTVLREFEIAPPVWASEWDGIAPIRQATGYSGMIEGTGNVLIARHCFERLGKPYFDPQFGLSGGEDRDFFIRLGARGMRFTRADNAVAYEHVPASRLRLGWSLQRAYRTGNTDMRIALKYRRDPVGLATEIAKIVAGIAAFPLLSIAYSLTPKRRLEGLRRLYRASGKIGALIGHHYHEYSVHHGH